MISERTNERTNESPAMCRVEMARGWRCVAEAVTADGYCSIHAKFVMAEQGTKCAICTKAIRSGTYAKRREDGKLEHSPVCPTKDAK